MSFSIQTPLPFYLRRMPSLPVRPSPAHLHGLPLIVEEEEEDGEDFLPPLDESDEGDVDLEEVMLNFGVDHKKLKPIPLEIYRW